MGIAQTLAPDQIKYVQPKIIFNEPKMPLRKVHDFWLRWKPLPKMMNIFLDHFWIFELNHIVFDFGHLNTINNLNAQIMLELFVGH